MTDPIVQHASQMLALAKKKHAAAIDAIERRPIDLQAAKGAVCDLADAELLVENALELSDCETLAMSLGHLRGQRVMLEQVLARMEAAPVQRSGLSPTWIVGSLVLAFAISASLT